MNGALLLGFANAVATEPRRDGRLLRYRFPGERGERALFTREASGLTSGIGPLAARFASAGIADDSVAVAASASPTSPATIAGLPILTIPGIPALSQSTEPAPPSLGVMPPSSPIPPPNATTDGGFAWAVSIAPGERYDASAIYAAYSADSEMQDQSVRPARPLFYGYTAHFDSVEAVIDYAAANQPGITEATRQFEERLTRSGVDAASRFAIAAGVRGYLASTFVLREQATPGDFGKPRYVVWEGDCLYLNTVDVAHETGAFEGAVMPWTLRLLLESWAAAKTRDRHGVVIPHDLGYDTTFTGVQAYSLLGGDMTAEELTNVILLARYYIARTGDSAFAAAWRPLLSELGDSLRNRDGDGDGVAERGAFYTTVDVPAAIHVAAASSYLAVKQAAANLALADLLGGAEGERARLEARNAILTLGRVANTQRFGLLPTLLPADWPAIIAEHRFTVETVGDLSSGGQVPNAILADGLLYLALAGHRSAEFDDLVTVVAASRWAAGPMLGMDGAQPRLHDGTAETWFSKLLVQQLIDDYLAHSRPTLPRVGLNALSLAGERHARLGIWGYTDSWNLERGYPVNLGHYPRGAVAFAFTGLPWRNDGVSRP